MYKYEEEKLLFDLDATLSDTSDGVGKAIKYIVFLELHNC